MSNSTIIWEGIVNAEVPQGTNDFYLRASTPQFHINSSTGDHQAYLGESFIGAEIVIEGDSAYTIVNTTGWLESSSSVKRFITASNASNTFPPGTNVTIVFQAAAAPTSESSSSAAGYTPGAPDVTEEYSISHGESTVKYSPLGGDVGITQKAVDDINAKEGSTAETAIQGSYAEDAADAKLLNHARLRNQGQI